MEILLCGGYVTGDLFSDDDRILFRYLNSPCYTHVSGPLKLAGHENGNGRMLNKNEYKYWNQIGY